MKPGKQSVSAEIITVGHELLQGNILNTNARFLGRELTGLGFTVKRQVSCPDQVTEIRDCLKEALGRSQLVILSGGLGPTPDDVTREGVASCFHVPLVLSEAQFARIKWFYKKFRRQSVPDLVREEALYPQNAVPLINRYGIALGFYLVVDTSLVVVLPGVPSELENMFHQLVRPLLRSRFGCFKRGLQLVVKMVGISEPEVMRRLGDRFVSPLFQFGIYPECGEITIRIRSHQPAILQSLIKKIKTLLDDFVYAYEDVSLGAVIGKILTRKKATLSVAESCTGGLLSSHITTIPGASRYFKGGLTAYANEVKKECLGISEVLLTRRGAVSQRVALEMAKKIRSKLKTTYGLGVTGIAGPSGGVRKKPVGLVYIALATPKKNHVWAHRFFGDRIQIQTRVVTQALEYLWREIR
ncbi:MAG: CinA family nicotinamide mononucleotide deamidase-related protein [Candidatus Omnitrophica bacterium]|nr:CinA family nicotinamide mononucleotide deamidase-related protein [Candidatus Omnitrophota bacterium]